MKNYLILFMAVLICCGCFPLFADPSAEDTNPEESTEYSSEEVLSADE